MVGAAGVTLLRIPYLCFFLGLMCLATGAETRLPLSGFMFLAVSGVLGLFLSDFLLYRAIGIIGPSTAVLLLSTSTIFSTVLGWLLLDEALPLFALAGVGAALAGIALVVTERSGSTLLPGQEAPRGRDLAGGLLLAAGSALAISGSFLALKAGLRTGIDPLWGAFVRLGTGALALWGTGAARGWVTSARQGLGRHPKVYWMLGCSCALASGGMWLSGLALLRAPVGVVSTLVNLQPIVVAVVGAAWYRRRLSWRILAGIVTAFGGTALICLS
jgi:drug/metabolite transporter (DMT)-like permease